jgi:pilus assembly protein CpaB
MRPKLHNVVLVLGVPIALFMGLYVYRLANAPTPEPVVTQTPTSQVLVAAVDVPFGTALEAHHLKTVAWPSDVLPPGAGTIADRDRLLGRVTLTRLSANQPVTEDKLAAPGSKGLLSLMIDQGMRAVTVRINEVTAVGGFIVPGSRVDVLITGTAPGGIAADGSPINERQTHTLLQNVTVIAIGQMLDNGSSAAETKATAAASTATLLVTPDQAEMLALASTDGNLQLVLRNFEDDNVTVTTSKKMRDLFEGTAGKEPEQLAATPKVELIRGMERLNVTF